MGRGIKPACLVGAIILLLLLLQTSHGTETPLPSQAVNPVAQSLLEHAIITSYLPFHRANRYTAPRLIYRYNGTQPGFGNRISNLLTAITLASLSRRILIIDWREPYDLFTFFNPRLNLKFSAEDEDKAEKECSSVACKASLLSVVLPKRHKTITYPSGLLHADLDMVLKLLRNHPELPASKALEGLLHESFNEAKFFQNMFESLLTPGKEIAQLMSAHSRDLKEPFIAVHARLGTGLHEFGPRWPHLSMATLPSCFANKARELGEKVGVRRFYLATDTKSFRPLFEREMRKRGVTVLRVEKVEPVHTRDCAIIPKGCLQAVFEFMILSRAKGMVASKSTFSQIAGFVGGVEIVKKILKNDC